MSDQKCTFYARLTKFRVPSRLVWMLRGEGVQVVEVAYSRAWALPRHRLGKHEAGVCWVMNIDSPQKPSSHAGKKIYIPDNISSHAVKHAPTLGVNSWWIGDRLLRPTAQHKHHHPADLAAGCNDGPLNRQGKVMCRPMSGPGVLPEEERHSKTSEKSRGYSIFVCPAHEN